MKYFTVYQRARERLGENVNLINDDNDLGASKDALHAIMDQQWNYCQLILIANAMEKLRNLHVSNMDPINKTLIWKIQAFIKNHAREGALVTISDDYAKVSCSKDKWDHVEIKTKYLFKSLKRMK